MKRSIEPKIVLHKSPSAQNSDGSYPVVMELVHKRRLFRKRLGFRAYPNQWDNERYISDKRIVRDYNERNAELTEIEEKAREILTDLGDAFAYHRFSELMDKAESSQLTFATVCNRYINELYDENRAGTAYYYESVANSVENYQKGVRLADIDKTWLRDFVKHYARRGAKCMAYLRGIKAIFGVAIADFGFDFTEMPFKTAYNPIGYDINSAKKVRTIAKVVKKGRLIEWLSKEQMELLKHYQPTNDGKQRGHDLFMFSYYTGGTNAKDIALLQHKDIVNGVWKHKRQKTGEIAEKPLTKNALDIINKYKIDSAYVFPFFLAGRDKDEREIKHRMNTVMSNLRRRYLSISKEIGLDGYYTFYTARRTAATILVNDGANLKAVQSALNHTNLAMTSAYIRSVDLEVMVETLERL